MNRSLAILQVLLLGFCCNAQEERQQDKRPFGIRIRSDTNPFVKDASIDARLRFIDRDSPSLNWFRALGFKETTGEAYEIRESYLRILNLPRDYEDALESAFRERFEQHENHTRPLRAWLDRERDELYIKHGVPARFAPNADAEVPRSKDIVEQIVHYQKKELEAEQQLIEKLTEILPPRDFAFLAEKWMNIRLLYIPVMQEYLGLSEDQVREIRKVCHDGYKLELELIADFRGDRIDDRNALLLSNREWHESNYRPFSFLTPAQFRIASKRLLKPWKSGQTFTQRLEQLAATKTLQSTVELEVLGELYREGAKTEQASK